MMMLNKSTSKGHIEWIDQCKGFAIFLVVVGHVVDYYRSMNVNGVNLIAFSSKCFNWIYAFHMALFYTISGFVFYVAYCRNREAKKENYKKQVINLIYAYFVFSIILWIFKMIFSSQFGTSVSVKDLLLLPIVEIAPYWYLWCLVLYYIFFYIYDKKVNDRPVGGYSYIFLE